jgi:PTH1 family peptidyl-tRNA hydrolase
MKLVVGLGNPGSKYKMTRHNIGFLAIDLLKEHLKAQGPLTKNSAEYYEASAFGEKVLLIKPLTFMNLSGKAVKPFFEFYKCTPSDLIVIHDEIDFEPYTLKIKNGGGTGGHNGLKSIEEEIGKENSGYLRIRMGVGKEGDPARHVLSEFPKKDFENLHLVLNECVEAVDLLLQNKVIQAMNQFNQKKE